MQRISSAVCRAVAAAFLFAAFSALPAHAAVTAPKAVTFYPNLAQLTVEDTITPEALPSGGKGFVITLPTGLNRQSFTLSLKGGEIAGMTWNDDDLSLDDKAADTFPDVSRRRELLNALTQLKSEIAQTDALIQVNKQRTRVLNNADSKLSEKQPVMEIEKLDALLEKQLTALSLELPVLEQTLAALRTKQTRLRNELTSLGGENVRRITLTIAVEDAHAPVTAIYSYMLPGCGWSPAYTAEARPEKNEVLFTQAAVLAQNTPIAWENVDVTVGTNTPDGRVTPGLLPAWRITERQTPPASPLPLAAGRDLANTMLSQSAAAESSAKSMQYSRRIASPAPTPAPVREERATFALWHIGKRNIPARSTARVILSKETWKAEFYYTLRPMIDKRGFLTASAKPLKPVDIPSGTASFLVDGSPAGNASLALYGDSLKLYFGPDPLVTATMQSDSRKSGETGIISKDATLSWNWTITVKNSRGKDVMVQVEDPSPASTDEAIKVEVISQPKPELNNLAYTWRLPMKAGETKTISHAVKATAPKDKPFNPGR